LRNSHGSRGIRPHRLVFADSREQESCPVSDDLSGFSMMELFRAETEGQTVIISEGLLSLEGGEADPATIEPMMRAAHSLKGAARIVGVDSAVRIAHAMEDCFVAAQRGQIVIRPGQVDLLLRAVDLLTRISQVEESQIPAWQAENEADIGAMVTDLTAVRRGEWKEPAAVVTPESPAPPEDEPGTASPDGRDAIVPVVAVEAKVPEPAEAAKIAEPPERVVRVTAESLTRLVALAGESLVQSRQLQPLVTALQSIRKRQTALVESLHALDERSNGETLAIRRAKTETAECAQGLLEIINEIEDYSRRSEELSGRLHHEVLASRMRPLADGVRGFPRLVRDLSRQLGKQVKLEIRGESTGVDRDILEKLEAPLNHLIRNALDHAIEMPEERVQARKDPVGTIRLEARHRSGMLQITLSDDGRGIDRQRLGAKVVARGLATAPMVEQMNEAEILEFLFLPGFSTKDAVTEISGRGVGLDVVQNMVRSVGGVVRVSTQAGKGTRFTLQLPITRSVIRALLVQIAGEPYAFPLNRIDRILIVRPEELKWLEGRRHFAMDDQPVGLVDAAQVLELGAASASGDSLAVVVASDRSHRFGVIVDGFLGERDLEVRPLDPRLGKVPEISSASILENGFPVLIIDVEDMVRSIDNLLSGRRLKSLGCDATEARRHAVKRVLVVDDSITVRELERQMLESRGYEVDVAVDGLDGWNAVRSHDYHLVISDVDMPRMDGIQLIRSVKADARLRAIPVIVVSYKDREEDRMRGLDAGANAYLTKSSFRDQTLIDTVVDLIGEPRD
jgi:two-component system sensor histidine kinase and response regulator WspE